MTTTSTFSGVNEDAKPSSRVLRPPGGASSNIFGVEPAAAAPKAKPAAASSKPADSGVFQGSTNNSGLSKDAQRTARDGDDSFNHLFGVTASSPVLTQNVEKGTSASQRVKTHDNLFGDTSGGQSPTGGKSHSSHDIIFGDQATPQGGRTTGPLTDSAMNQSDIFQTNQSTTTNFPAATRAPHSRSEEKLLKDIYKMKQSSYNPITGADYKDLAPNHHALHVKEVPKAQKEQPQLPCSDGEFQAREGKMQNVQTSTRVTNPPGGKTHKLW